MKIIYAVQHVLVTYSLLFLIFLIGMKESIN
jgi:hypothetical protein